MTHEELIKQVAERMYKDACAAAHETVFKCFHEYKGTEPEQWRSEILCAEIECQIIHFQDVLFNRLSDLCNDVFISDMLSHWE